MLPQSYPSLDPVHHIYYVRWLDLFTTAAFISPVKNLDRILEVIQHNLDLLADWCERCGFKINTDKTVVVLFTHRTDKIEKDLKINDKPLTVEKTVKFLGLIFDSKLTWNAHINYIEEKCKKKLEYTAYDQRSVMGAGKATLLTVYRALIRSVLDYGSIAYNSTSLTNKLKLDRIQSKALRIICGAFCSTSILRLCRWSAVKCL